MYPGTHINLIDQSDIEVEEIVQMDYKPLILTVSTFARGPEKWVVTYGDQFFRLFGSKMDFEKNGQPALQAANVIRNGGALLVKRLVADDATLANLIYSLILTTKVTVREATEEDDPSTTVELSNITGNAADTNLVVITDSKIDAKWIATSVSNVSSLRATVSAAADTYEEGEVTGEGNDDDTITYSQVTTYPMMVFVDNGRGVSTKSIRIIPDYVSSSGMDVFFYDVNVYEGTSVLDRSAMTLNPNYVFDKTMYGLNEDTSIQFNASNVPGMFEKVVDKMSSVLGVDAAEVKSYDLIFMTTGDEAAIENVYLDPESIDLNADYGVDLSNGSNGSFDEAPFGTELYVQKAIEALDGTFDPAIYDVDEYKIAACFDANYPEDVKNAIAELANFRKDFHFFRDLGLNVKSYNTIVSEAKKIPNKYRTFYMSIYFTTYQIYDPETMLRERVTMMYDFAAASMGIFSTGAYRPYAGIVNGMILESAIKGTVNFIPRVIPAVNQKKLIDDARLNYAIFTNDQCVVQSLYTAQKKYTQLSYVNNVTGIQEVIRAIRTACPKWRYTFVTNADFSLYSKNVADTIAPYKSYFSMLTFEYQQNRTKVKQKIFYGVIKVKFGDWAQAEEFDVYALGD